MLNQLTGSEMEKMSPLSSVVVNIYKNRRRYKQREPSAVFTSSSSCFHFISTSSKLMLAMSDSGKKFDCIKIGFHCPPVRSNPMSYDCIAVCKV